MNLFCAVCGQPLDVEWEISKGICNACGHENESDDKDGWDIEDDEDWEWPEEDDMDSDEKIGL